MDGIRPSLRAKGGERCFGLICVNLGRCLSLTHRCDSIRSFRGACLRVRTSSLNSRMRCSSSHSALR
eukprot:1194505-Prorocentrum_minimum.AAC.2